MYKRNMPTAPKKTQTAAPMPKTSAPKPSGKPMPMPSFKQGMTSKKKK